MTTLIDRVEDQLSEAKAADVRSLNERIVVTENTLRKLRAERDALISFKPADSLDQESTQVAEHQWGADDDGHFDRQGHVQEAAGYGR